jgi:hypothetical protein
VQLDGRWLPALVVSGALLAAIPMYALDRAFESYMTSKAVERLDAQAVAALSLAEARLDHAADVLTRLAATGIEECGPAALEAIPQNRGHQSLVGASAALPRTFHANIGVMDQSGRALVR